MQIVDSAHEIKDRANDWLGHTTDYLETRWNLGVLDASEKAAGVVSSMAAALIVGVVGTFTLLFASLGAALLIGNSLNSLAAGCFIVALFYAVVGSVLYVVRDGFIKIPVINSFIKRFYYEG